MDNKTKVYLQSIVGEQILEEKSFTMADLLRGRHLKWCREQQADADNLVWISCSEQQLSFNI